jgi:hypothetical protein
MRGLLIKGPWRASSPRAVGVRQGHPKVRNRAGYAASRPWDMGWKDFRFWAGPPFAGVIAGKGTVAMTVLAEGDGAAAGRRARQWR